MNKIEFNDSLLVKYLATIITIMQIIAIILANFTILVLFSKFFIFDRGFIIYSIICFLVSFLLLKSDMFFWFGKDHLNNAKKGKNLINSSNKKISDNFKIEMGLIKYNLWNALLILFRTLFFNLMDYFFIVIVMWLALLGPFYYIGIITPLAGFSIEIFSEILTVIGIISGFLQIYITQLKNSIIQKITNSIIEYINLSTSDISFIDFMHYLKKANPSDSSLFNRVRNIIFGSDSSSSIRNGYREKIRERYFYSLSGDPLLYLFSYLDAYEEFDEEKSKNSEELQRYYNTYFKDKLEDFKSKVEANFSEINRIKRILYANIPLLSEAMADTAALNLELTEETKNPKKFEEFYNNYRNDCIFILFKQISNKIF